MEKLHIFSLVVSFIIWCAIFHEGLFVAAGCPKIGYKQLSGYVEVRPKSYMFWLLYKNCGHQSTKSLPTLLCLAGGPGLSAVGFSNLGEVGPLDIYLNPRSDTWLKTAHLLFVDSPVGTGYSYVEDPRLLVKTDDEATADLTKLLINVFEKLKDLQKTDLYIQGESYGGKLAVTLGLSALHAIKEGRLKVNSLGGVVMGAAWISPGVQVLAWGPLLRDVSRLDNNGIRQTKRLADKINQEIGEGKFVEAFDSYNDLKDCVVDNGNGVDIFNFMLDKWDDVAISTGSPQADTTFEGSGPILPRAFNYTHLHLLMNGEMKERLRIPNRVPWVGRSLAAHLAMKGAFMKPISTQVDELLATGVSVTIYTAQLDVICSPKGTEAWVENLKWGGLKSFLRSKRSPIYCGGDANKTGGFFKSKMNLNFYWILGAGHFVPMDQPCAVQNMIANITQSPIP